MLLRSESASDSSWSPLEFVEEVKRQTVDRYADCKRSGWISYKEHSGSIITKNAETIINAVLEVRELMSAGLKFDMTGYAATAWSIITLGLQVSRISSTALMCV